MTKKIALFVIAAGLFFTACQKNTGTSNAENKSAGTVETPPAPKMTDVPYQVARNYFVKNTVGDPGSPKIETADKFNEIFGMATVMGKDGKPTAIDFSKQYVLAVILSETDLETTVAPASLQKFENNVILTYKTTVGQKQSYKTRPSFAIIVDKSNDGNVVLKEIK